MIEQYPDGYGIVRTLGWQRDEESGREIFRAIIEFPAGPPTNLTFGTVWDKKPVLVTEAT